MHNIFKYSIRPVIYRQIIHYRQLKYIFKYIIPSRYLHENEYNIFVIDLFIMEIFIKLLINIYNLC